jgi:hypothetical protein
MRALSLTQPWATAVALEIKRWETRSWPTGFRGELCIHAAKGFPGWAKEFMQCKRISPMFPPMPPPLGAIVCVCEVTECRRTQDIREQLSEQEQLFGDYTDGRYAFKLENVRRLKAPVSARGALGLWAVGWDEAIAVIRQLKEAA